MQNAEIHFPDDVKSLSMSDQSTAICAFMLGQYMEFVNACFDSVAFHQNSLS